MPKILTNLHTYLERLLINEDSQDDVRLGRRIFIFLYFYISPLFLATSVYIGLVGNNSNFVWFSIFLGSFFTLNFLLFLITRSFRIFFSIWAISSLMGSFVNGLLFGGFQINFGTMWFYMLPLVLGLMVFEGRGISWWVATFAGFVLVSVNLDFLFYDPQKALLNINYVNSLVIITAGVSVLLSISYYKNKQYIILNLLKIEKEKSENILLNTLPKSIIPILKSGQQLIANNYDEASVMFVDIVGSTKLFSSLEPNEAVDWLNEVFSTIDLLVEIHGVEKVRTIGDGYMIASGVPVLRDDHAQSLCFLGLDLIDAIKLLPTRKGKKVSIRIGINSGPLVAGVIGKSKYQFDLWGDTVNIASRMESTGVAGKVHISEATEKKIKSKFILEKRENLSIKGKGNMDTWFVLEKKQDLHEE